jgi:NAD+ synthase (glutamine-hydrolysing)
MVFGMARLALESIRAGEEKTLTDLRRVTGDQNFLPKTPEEIVSRLFHTCYMGTVSFIFTLLPRIWRSRI